MNWSNHLTQLFGIKYPIVQAPMFGVSTPEMTAAVSNFGALGSLALGDLNAEKTLELLYKTKSLTNKTFAANIFVHQIPEITSDLKLKYNRIKDFLQELTQRHHLEVNFPKIEDLKVSSYHEQVDAVIEAGCKILSFTFGNLDSGSIQKLKSNGVTLMGTCTSVEEAIVLEKSGIEVICVQGWEAGGHRGSLTADMVPEIGGLSLLAQVRDSVKVPLIYAGGVYDAKTFSAAKILGADAVQVGSILLCSAESALHDFEKARLQKAREEEVIVTKAFSGRSARGIRNTFITEMELFNEILPYPYQNKLTGEMRREAKQNKNAEFVNIWVGQSLHTFNEKSTSDILQNLIFEIENQ